VASDIDIPLVDMDIIPMAIPMDGIWIVHIVGYILADLILDLALMGLAVPTQYFIIHKKGYYYAYGL
jgi:hypothetical protein